MHVLYIGPFAQRTGYAQAAHDYMLALHRAGVSIEIAPIVECDTDDLEPRYAELLPLVRGYPGHQRREPTHIIVHTIPARAHEFVEEAVAAVALAGEQKEGIDTTRYGKPTVAITTWETDHVPSWIEERLRDYFDAVIVPSGFCAGAFSGLNAKVVGHCFDPNHWPEDTERPDAYGPFRFYSILGWSERKNPIGLLKAYFHEFDAHDHVVLSLLVSDFNQSHFDALKACMGIPERELPNVEIVTDYLDHDGVVEFHHKGHCFVTASRGEGWNLPAFEAAVMGRPVIAPRFGGHTGFLQKYEYYYQVPCQSTPVVMSPVAGRSVGAYGVTMKQTWAEPDLCELGAMMREAHDVGRVREPRAREWLIEHFGYEVIAQKLIDILRGL